MPGDPLLDPASHNVQVPGPQPLAVGQGGLHARLEQRLLPHPGPMTKISAWFCVEQNLTMCKDIEKFKEPCKLLENLLKSSLLKDPDQCSHVLIVRVGHLHCTEASLVSSAVPDQRNNDEL